MSANTAAFWNLRCFSIAGDPKFRATQLLTRELGSMIAQLIWIETLHAGKTLGAVRGISNYPGGLKTAVQLPPL